MYLFSFPVRKTEPVKLITPLPCHLLASHFKLVEKVATHC